MPDITLTVTAAQETRIATALAFLNEVPSPPPATAAQVKAWLMRQLKAQVLRYELGLASSVAEATKRTELKTEGW